MTPRDLLASKEPSYVYLPVDLCARSYRLGFLGTDLSASALSAGAAGAVAASIANDGHAAGRRADAPIYHRRWPELTSTSTSVKATGGQALITYKQKTSYDFDDDQVEGSVLQPDGDIVSGRGKSHHESLVKARTTFIPEMFKSAENL